MDGERSVNDLGKAAVVDFTVVAAGASVPLHVTFDEPLATVFQEGVGTSEPELRDQPGEPPAAAIDKPSKVACVRCRSRSTLRRGRRVRKRSHMRRIRSRSLRTRNYDCDRPFVVQMSEEEVAGDDRLGGDRKSKECLPPRTTGHSRPRDDGRQGDWHCGRENS
ncbi:unnamed protein product [Macrosiphum euphorbiae]|uniref:Uncharacterized protein n=1 Tax=Macrosiphum euphorbiae TaxID=13131 RepID=A0AAV0WIL7_9HEMI|nr:unnamed protein product [Macrosiphum euphorbiae]